MTVDDDAKSDVAEYSTAADAIEDPSQPKDVADHEMIAPPAAPPSACAHWIAGSSASGGVAPSKRMRSTR